MKKKIFKIVKIIGSGIIAVLILLFAVRAVGVGINRRTPKGGINESMYVEINGTKQWISIYGDNLSNPVLLYLHGGPGSPTSEFDYVITRKWADVYTVVTWDQRNCGKSYDAGQNEIELTRDLLLEDGKEMTEFLLDYLSADQITILGHSWGSIYGANLVLEYPEYYECFIGTGQLVDSVDNERAFQEAALSWAEGDEESLALVAQLTPESMTMEHILARNALMENTVTA
ncbi:MAG: alpha/beta hydrolase [Roseburia sp.]|nr:alpha/beta hydrolase [Roseburia sp.]MCM1096660.1 alpha/beta hydrolase [Ruminococcus flavefaciens]